MEKMTADLIDKQKVPNGSPIHDIIEALNCTTSYMDKAPEKSIMDYGRICDHDDGYLCEHRLQWIVNFLVQKNAFKND